jgi:hypothetical protein
VPSKRAIEKSHFNKAKKKKKKKETALYCAWFYLFAAMLIISHLWKLDIVKM